MNLIQMLRQSDRTREPLVAVAAEVDDAVSAEVLVQIHASARGVVAQLARVHVRIVLDVVHEQVAVAVDLLLELAVADVALVQHRRALVGLHLEACEVVAAGLHVQVVLADMVLQ